MLRIAVCDDSSEFLEKATGFIEKWAENSTVPMKLYRFDNGDALLAESAASHMDIVFLDIIMPLLNGMETAKELRQNDNAVKIVFLTSSPEFALDSYEVKAHGYLLKPVTFEKISEILDESIGLSDLEPKKIVVKTACGYHKLYYHDIEFVEAQNKKVVFYLRSGKTVGTPNSLHSFEDIFTVSEGFFKSHRSYLVNLTNVDHFSMAEIITKSGRTVPIARGYGNAFKEAYFSQIFRD